MANSITEYAMHAGETTCWVVGSGVGSERSERARPIFETAGRDSHATMAMCAEASQVKARLQAKGKHRPHSMIRRKLPDGAELLDKLPRRDRNAPVDDEAADIGYTHVSGLQGQEPDFPEELPLTQ